MAYFSGDADGSFGGREGNSMLPDLRVDGTELEVIKGEHLFFMQVSAKFIQMVSIFAFCLGSFEVEVDVVDDGLKVVG